MEVRVSRSGTSVIAHKCVLKSVGLSERSSAQMIADDISLIPIGLRSRLTELNLGTNRSMSRNPGRLQGGVGQSNIAATVF